MLDRTFDNTQPERQQDFTCGGQESGFANKAYSNARIIPSTLRSGLRSNGRESSFRDTHTETTRETPKGKTYWTGVTTVGCIRHHTTHSSTDFRSPTSRQGKQ
ncbi:unnamed protein product [Ectocarpus sp. 12 AP-2014]